MNVLPLKLRVLLRRKFPLLFPMEKGYLGQSRSDVFRSVYESGAWGKGSQPGRRYYSGSGSDEEDIVSTYVTSVAKYLESKEDAPVIVDAGCGDFFVGSQFVKYASRYHGIDIFDGIIEQNKDNYAQFPSLSFAVLDICEQQLPFCDFVFIRQVFQHLDNQSILAALNNIAGRAKYLIFTEHLPEGKFVPNLDKPVGASIRLAIGSGVVLTEEPFNLRPSATEVICEVPEAGGVIRTIGYTL